MTRTNHSGTSRFGFRAWTLAAALAVGTAAGAAQAGAPEPASQTATSVALSDLVWDSARSGGEDQLATLLDGHMWDDATIDPAVRASLELYSSNRDKRETDRATQIEEVSGELDDHIAAWEADRDPISLSDAMSSAIGLQLLKNDDDAFFADARVSEIIRQAERAAEAAERAGDWVIASELYYRLDTMHDPASTYEADLDRLSNRLAMIRLYAPERLWELRNTRRIAEGLDALPPYNPYGDDFNVKLNGITSTMVRSGIQRAAQQHIGRATRRNPEGVTLNTMLLGGIDAVRTMVTTTDLSAAFEGLGNATKREAFLARLDEQRDKVAGWDRVASAYDLRRVVDAVLASNLETTQVMPEAILHEFGNGVMAQLDDYTAIIWPDEVSRFRRSTDGEFFGVGIQIQLDELQNITIVTPLEGTPAQRAGVRSGDIIKKVDGITAVGLGLDQAVEVITGPANTKVTLTVEREDDEGDLQELDFNLVRQRIDLPTVKGWSKTGPGDADWDWFIDRDQGIGYLRLTGFTDDSTREFDRAVSQMRREGLSSLILDLRYNPGGLLDQAVSIASRFVPEGMIVKTVDAAGVPNDQKDAQRLPDHVRLTDIPVVLLINEGSASASEIVAGAVQASAEMGTSKALLIGQRSFGKGSVQNVYMLPGNRAAMKLTTHYYRVNSPRMIHKLPGSSEWGVDPDLSVAMLPSQQAEALMLRRDADVLPLDEFGNIIEDAERPDPDTLLSDGVDLQVHTALVVLQTQGVDIPEQTSLKN